MKKGKGYIRVFRLSAYASYWSIIVRFPNGHKARVLSPDSEYHYWWCRRGGALRFANRLAKATGYKVVVEK